MVPGPSGGKFNILTIHDDDDDNDDDDDDDVSFPDHDSFMIIMS